MDLTQKGKLGSHHRVDAERALGRRGREERNGNRDQVWGGLGRPGSESHFSHCCDRILTRAASGAKGVLWVYVDEGALVCLGGKERDSSLKVRLSWSRCLCIQEAERGACWSPAAFFFSVFIQSKTIPSMRRCPSHSERLGPPQLNLWKIPIVFPGRFQILSIKSQALPSIL